MKQESPAFRHGECQYETFYFLTKKDNKVYNSCWDKKEYKTEKEARTACEKWIDEQEKL